jgi:hypothetical protein
MYMYVSIASFQVPFPVFQGTIYMYMYIKITNPVFLTCRNVRSSRGEPVEVEHAVMVTLCVGITQIAG